MQTFTVMKVIDGDTFEIDPAIPRYLALQTPMQGLGSPNVFNKIRLANINTPEIWTLQGQQAAGYLKQLIEGKRVTLKNVGISYDRVVADVWRYPDNVFVNSVMVHSGYAKRA